MMRRLYPEELLEEARRWLNQRLGSSGMRARTAAFLTRQAMEELFAEAWRTRAPGLEQVNMRAQLLCLPTYLRDEELARQLTLTYWALSQACHHHVYELTPSISELRRWMEVVAELARHRELRGV